VKRLLAVAAILIAAVTILRVWPYGDCTDNPQVTGPHSCDYNTGD